MDVILRRATEDDLPAILATYNDAVATLTATWDHDPVDLENRRAWLSAHNTEPFVTLVAESDGVLVGFGGYGTFRAKVGYSKTVESTTYVVESARGRGIGTRLTLALEDAARERGFHVMVGGISADNDVNLGRLRKLGWTEAGRLPQVGHKFGRWLDLVFMVKVLDDRRNP